MNKIRSSTAAIILILSYEQLRLIRYKDSAGYFTIGWGHKLQPSENYLVITRDKANSLFINDLLIAESGVSDCVNVQLNPNQFGACVSLAFNIGIGAFRSSSVCKNINDGNFNIVPTSFSLWRNDRNPATGKLEVKQDLIERRNSEVVVWNTPMPLA